MRGFLLVSGLIFFGFLRPSFAATAADPGVRGEYFATHVAMCVQCHSPRDAKGELERTRLFKGAPIPLRSPFPSQHWAFAAPAIAGLPGWTNDDATILLTTGRRRAGYVPKPPMPPFRLSREDAEAIVAYLRSFP
jgi:mono/diheme cytochrome c family protein